MRARAAIALVLGGLATGCFRLSQPAPQIREYRLDYTPPVVTGNALPVIVRVPPLRVAAVYDREPIVYRDDAYSTGTYFYHRWSANPGQMLADLLARDLAESGRYRAVQQGPSVLPADYQLTGEIEEMEERAANGTCAAHLRLRIVLQRARSTKGDPVALRTAYAADESCTCSDARALAEAMSRAMAQISSQLQRDVYAAVAADLPPP